jgi:hypothetical protein
VAWFCGKRLGVQFWVEKIWLMAGRMMKGESVCFFYFFGVLVDCFCWLILDFDMIMFLVSFS